jgi:hypothetical protein
MSEWSPTEINRTVEEIKRRSLIDPEFRALALSNPLAAIAKVNPRPVPEGLAVRFAERSRSEKASEESVSANTIVLPDPLARIVELSDAELEEAAGGDGGPAPKLRI